MQLGIYFSSLPILRRLRNSPLEKIEIEILAAVRKTARHNLRFRIPDRAPQHAVAPILDRNNGAIGGITEDLQHLARKNPVVSVQNPRSRSNDNSSHRGNCRAAASSAKRRRASGSACPTNVSAIIVSAMRALREIELPGIKKLRSGKVREVFDLGDTLLFVVSDRLSAFWFQKLDFAKNHFITADFDEFPQSLRGFRDQLAGRSMLVKKTDPLTIECVVRGYLAGSGWKDYQQNGSVCGVKLPDGLQLASKLPGPIFTPSTKSDVGHDLNIDLDKARRMIGAELIELARDLSLEIYQAGGEYAAARGIIIADTKFEFGRLGDELLLIDECLTPDSSRFWPVDEYRVGTSPPSFDKQFVRDYLETLDWDKTPPAPHLPREIVEKTSAKYREAFSRLTGGKLE